MTAEPHTEEAPDRAPHGRAPADEPDPTLAAAHDLPQRVRRGSAPANDEPTDGGPVNGEPAEYDPTNDESADGGPAKGKLAAYDPTNDEPADHQPANDEPADHQLANDELADHQPVNDELADHQPVNSELADHQPVNSELADHQPVNSEPADHQPVNSEPADDTPDPAYRGVAKVGKPRTVRARAVVPGALSIPRPRPRRVPRWAQPTATFPRRVFPQAPPPGDPPELRAAAPDKPGTPDSDALGKVAAAEGAPGGGASAGSAPDRGAPDDGASDSGVPEKSIAPMKRRPRRVAVPAVAAVLAAFAAGTGYFALADRPPEDDLGRWTATAGATATATASATSAGGPVGSVADGKPQSRPPGDPFGAAAVVAQGRPTRLRIAAVRVDTPLETLRLGDDGTLQPPQGFARAGWYAGGTAPGDVGPAVIAGHVDSKKGPAVFYRLRELTAGDRVDVTRGGRTLRFTVTAVRWYPKSAFPTDDVYGPTPDRQLRLITCGGVFDKSLRSYRDNLVVYAVAG